MSLISGNEENPVTGRCYRCGVRLKTCVCAHITPLHTRTKLVLLMHPKEFKKERLGTGRMTRAGLLNSEMIMGIDFTQDRRVNELIQDPQNACMVLWPGADALSWNGENRVEDFVGKRTPVVFLLDGTWTCARKMYRHSSNLQALPKISLSPSRPSAFTIKQQPDVRCVSTAEATQLLFEELSNHGIEPQQNWESLALPLIKMNEQQLKIASDPNRVAYRKGTYDPAGTLARAQEGVRSRKLF